MIQGWVIPPVFSQVNFGSVDTIGFWVAITWAFTAVVNVSFAIAVLSDARRRNTFLVPDYIWSLATLLGGALVAGIYWIIHHSTLRSEE